MNYLRDTAEAIRQKVPTHLLPDEDSATLFLLYAVLARAKGTSVTREDVHNAWVAWMLIQGNEGHESMVPFSKLGPDTRREDEPFVEAIRSVASH